MIKYILFNNKVIPIALLDVNRDILKSFTVIEYNHKSNISHEARGQIPGANFVWS